MPIPPRMHRPPTRLHRNRRKKRTTFTMTSTGDSQRTQETLKGTGKVGAAVVVEEATASAETVVMVTRIWGRHWRKARRRQLVVR